MGPPIRRQGSPAARGALLAACWAVCAGGCATSPDGPPPQSPPAPSPELEAAGARLAAGLLEAAFPPAPPSALRVRLAFEAGADLDLYVTGPSYETVYFANTPSREGGRLDADVRCCDPTPRVEKVAFPDAKPGPYRVGVDFPERCEGGADRIAFAIRVEGPGMDETRSGVIDERHFLPIVFEWNLPR